MTVNPLYYSENVKRIENIEFSIYCNKDIKKYSTVCDDPYGIDLAESYENFEPKKGGLVDLRLGTCDIYLFCTTCGENSLDCPGHFGHTELAEPVFHYGFLNHVKTLLQCICLNCSNILMDKSQHNIKKIANKKSESRFKEIKLIAKNANACYVCNTPIIKIKKEVKDTGSIKIVLDRVVNQDTKTDNITGQTFVKKIKDYLTPRHCYNILRNISDFDCHLLGFNVALQRPEDLIIEKFPIPPTIIRPTSKLDFLSSANMEDSLTLKISDIITANKRVRQQLEKEAVLNELSTYNQDIFNLLQYHVATYFDNESISLPRTEFKTGGKITKSICNRIESKAGRMRNNLMGKRVDFSARTVITSDPYIAIDQVGIPIKIATELTIPEEVTAFNINHLSKLVKNGRDKYPGANYIIRITYKDSKYDIQKIDLKYRKKAIQLCYGDIVERHIINDDYVLFNRQPTLHKPSMMGHRVQVIDNNDLNTFRMNVSVCKPYNADFDGDEMNIHMAQSIQARNEIKRIASVQYQIISSTNSSPIIGCQQDTISGAFSLTKPNIKLIGSDVANILCNTTSTTKYTINLKKYYSGHEIFSFIIPKGINIKIDDDKDNFNIKDGNLLAGYLNKSMLSFAKKSIIHIIWDKFGPVKTKKFIDDSQRLILNYLMLAGQTVGFKDAVMDTKIVTTISNMINTGILETKYKITQFENTIEDLSIDIIEQQIIEKLDSITNNASELLVKNINKDNFFWLSAKSGAKGASSNIVQISGLLGQQVFDGKRYKKSIQNRTMIYFHRDDDTPEARGFVKNSFFTGLEGHEFFIHTTAGRSGLIDSRVKSVTWETPLIIINKGIPEYVRIGEWIDNKLANNSSNIIKEELYNNESLDISNVYITSMDYNGNLLWSEIKNITRHDPDETMYSITTESGRNVIVTGSKSLLIWNENKQSFNEVYTSSIKINDYLPVSYNMQNYSKILYYIVINAIKLEFNFINGVIIGLILADGNIINNQIEFNTNNISIKNYIITWVTSDYFTNIYGICDIQLSDNKIIVKNEIYVSLIKKIIDYKKNIPKESFIAPQEFRKGLITGYFSIRCLIISNPPTIQTYSYNEQFINSLSFICSLLGIYGSFIHTLDCIYYNISKKFIRVFTQNIELIDNTFVKMLQETILYNDIQTDTDKLIKDVILDRIVDIKLITNHNINKVYDITIPPTYNFGLANGLQVRDTAQTGYIQRQLIKGLEDLSIKYDGTNRNAKGIIIQMVYGDNGINQACQTELKLEVVNMNDDNIKDTFLFDNNEINHLVKSKFKSENKDRITITKQELINFNLVYFKIIKDFRDTLRSIQAKATLNYKILQDEYVLPVNLFRLTQDYTSNNKIIDLHPEDIIDKIEKFLTDYNTRLIVLANKNNKLLVNDDIKIKYILKLALYEYLCPKKCLFTYNLTKLEFEKLMKELKHNFIRAICEPGEMVGIIAAQSIGEPTSQMTLNTKHHAGSAKKGSSSSGLNRIQELLHYSKNTKTPIMTIYFHEPFSNNKNEIKRMLSYFTYLNIKQLVTNIEIYYIPGINDKLHKMIQLDNVSNPFFINNQTAELETMPFLFRFKMDINKMTEKRITLLDIKTKFIIFWSTHFQDLKNFKKHEKDIFLNITKCCILSNNISDSDYYIHIRFGMNTYNYSMILDFLKIVYNDIILKGIKNIENATEVYELEIKYDSLGNVDRNTKEYHIVTDGINMEQIKYIKGINTNKTMCNDIYTIFRLYGIEAARQMLIYEFVTTYKQSINNTHLTLLVDQMCHMGEIISIDRHGLSKIDVDPLAKASFEKTMDHFIHAAIFNEKDNMKSVSSRIAIGRVIPGGTGIFDLLLNTRMLAKIENSHETTELTNVFRPDMGILLEESSIIKEILNDKIKKIDFFNP